MLLQTSAWMDKYNIPIENVVRHYDASRKMCPGNWQWNDWAKWKQFKKDLADLRNGKDVKGIKSTSVKTNRFNPKGYPESPSGDYRKPTQPFGTVKVGDTVTIRNGCNWFNPETKNFIVSPKIKEHYGKKYKIIEEKAVSNSYSKKAFLLDGVLSWILEQDLEEPRKDWDKTKSASKYTVKKGDYLYKIAQVFDTTVDKIKKWNHLNTNVIHVGQVLFVAEPQEVVEDVVEKPEKPVQGVEPIKDQPKDEGDKTVAIELKEGQIQDWLGNVYEKVEK